MPKKRSEPSVIEMAMKGRWPVAAALSAIWFVIGVLIVPSVLVSNRFLVTLAPLARTVSLLIFFVFAAVALVKFLQDAAAARTADQLTKHLAVVQRARERAEARSRSPASSASDDTVGRSNARPFGAASPIPSEPAAGSSGTEPSMRPTPTEWSLALLQSIEWKRFEEVVAAYFRANDFRCETLEYGPDGGIDGRLYFGDLPDPVGAVQCKAWARQVDVKPVRELLGVMAHEKVARGYFCATGDFSREAIAFAAANPIKLITGPDLLDAIAQMPLQAQQHLLAVSTTGDYTTPTCPSCGIKLVERTIGGKAAWACRNYPRCDVKIFRKTIRPVDRDGRTFRGAKRFDGPSDRGVRR